METSRYLKSMTPWLKVPWILVAWTPEIMISFAREAKRSSKVVSPLLTRCHKIDNFGTLAPIYQYITKTAYLLHFSYSLGLPMAPKCQHFGSLNTPWWPRSCYGNIQVHQTHDPMAQGTMDPGAMYPRNHDFLRARGPNVPLVGPSALNILPPNRPFWHPDTNILIYHENILFTIL